MNATRRYGLLRVIAMILKIVAWVVLVAGIVGLVAGLGAAGGAPEMLGSILRTGSWALPVLAIVWFVQLYAFGSVISLLIEIEENTRAMASQ